MSTPSHPRTHRRVLVQPPSCSSTFRSKRPPYAVRHALPVRWHISAVQGAVAPAPLMQSSLTLAFLSDVRHAPLRLERLHRHRGDGDVGGRPEGGERRGLDPRGDLKRRVHLQDGLRAFFLHGPATTEIYTLSLHDALPI